MASFQKVVDACKKAFFNIKGKPGFPSIKQGASDIGKSIDVQAIKKDIQTIKLKESVDELLGTIKAKVNQASKKSPSETPNAGSTSSALSAQSVSGENPLDNIKKAVPNFVNTVKMKIAQFSKGGKLDVGSIKKSLTDLTKKLDVNKIKKSAQEAAAKAQANLPKKPEKK